MSRTVQVRWTSLQSAADLLGLTPGALRKILERNARKGADGVTEALVNGVHARKLGRLWRVTLSPAWSDPLAGSGRSRYTALSSQSTQDDRDGDRS